MRSDLHRPSVIVPADYRFVSCDYYGSGLDAVSFMGDRMVFRAFCERTGAKHSSHDHAGTCGVCGASAMYVARFHHVPSNTIVTTGMDCAEKMDIADPIAFRSFKKRIAAGRKAYRGKAVAQAFLAERNASAAWEVYTATDSSKHGKDEGIVVDMVGKLVRYGSLSDKQMAFMARLLAAIAERPAREAARAAERAATAATSQFVGTPGERRQFELTLTFKTSFETQFGLMLVYSFKDRDGNVVVYKGSKALDVERGDTVTLTATVKAHQPYTGISQTLIARPVQKPVAAAQPVAATEVLAAA